MTNAWIVILNWNGREDTLELLHSLREAKLPTTTVLVVDNGSQDGSLAAIKSEHSWVQTLQTGRNLGYAGGNNRGIAYALQHEAEVVGVLNNDTLVSPDFWSPLVHLAEGGAVAVCPDIRYSDSPGQSWFFGGVISRDEGCPRHLRPDEQPARDGHHCSEILTGCCLVASAETWRKVGPFDEHLFLIFEDSDWCMRAKECGITLLLEPASRIDHKVSRSFRGSAAGIGLFYYCRNGLIFAHRWLGPRATLRFLSRTVIRESLSELRHEGLGAWCDIAIRVLAAGDAVTGRRGAAGSFVRRVSRYCRAPN
jgi:GT2 family glycosyltransferase